MILTDVFVPSVSKHYAFRLDEKALISVIIAELTELICQQEQFRYVEGFEKMSLCTYREYAVMSKEKTLFDYGIDDGERLILL